MKEEGGLYIVFLKAVSALIPGTYLKTLFYLNAIYKPRKILRKLISGFYRMDHVHEVIKEISRYYEGRFTILEFGVSDGYSLVKTLNAVRYHGMEDRIEVHGFDTFEGLPESRRLEDQALIKGNEWLKGDYQGGYEGLKSYCQKKYRNFTLHKGLFEETLTEDFLKVLVNFPPILIWIDCDLYISTKTALERLIPFIPTGCVIYFDDICFNFSSRFTGEMRVVWEINHGLYSEGIELVPDVELSWSSNRVYRFINTKNNRKLELACPVPGRILKRKDDSPFP